MTATEISEVILEATKVLGKIDDYIARATCTSGTVHSFCACIFLFGSCDKLIGWGFYGCLQNMMCVGERFLIGLAV